MTKQDDGSINLKMPVLVALLSACLAVGSGGAWYASGSTTTSEAKAVSEHVAALQVSNAVQDTQIAALQKQLDKIETKQDETIKKLDRLLARR